MFQLVAQGVPSAEKTHADGASWHAKDLGESGRIKVLPVVTFEQHLLSQRQANQGLVDSSPMLSALEAAAR